MQKSQQGATLIGVILFWGLVAFFLYIAMCLIPLYLENYSVKSSLESVQSDPAIFSPTTIDVRYAIKEGLRKRLMINNVKRVQVKDVTIDGTPEGYKVTVAYDAQTHLIANIDVVIHFNDSILIKKQ